MLAFGYHTTGSVIWVISQSPLKQFSEGMMGAELQTNLRGNMPHLNGGQSHVSGMCKTIEKGHPKKIQQNVVICSVLSLVWVITYTIVDSTYVYNIYTYITLYNNF